MIQELNRVRHELPGFGSYTDELMQGLLTKLSSGQPSYDVSPQATAQYFQTGVMDPLMRSYEQNLVPQLNSAFAGANAAQSSMLGQAKARALGDISSQGAAQLAQWQQGNQQLQAQLADAAQGRMLGALQMAPGVGSAELQRAGLLQGLLGPYQQQAQSQATSQYQEFLRQQPEGNPWLQYALQFTGQPQMGVYQGSDSGLGSGIGALLGLGLAPFTGGSSTFLGSLLGLGGGGATWAGLGGGIGTGLGGFAGALA